MKWCTTLLFILLAGCGKPEVRISQQNPTAPDSGWTLDFNYSVTPPNPGAGAPTTRIAFTVSHTGDFVATQTVCAISGELTSRSNQSGKLSPELLRQLQQLLTATDLPSLAPGPIELEAGSGDEDGWGGIVIFTQFGKTTTLHYSSRGGYPNDPKAREHLERFSTFLNHVINLAVTELKKKNS